MEKPEPRHPPEQPEVADAKDWGATREGKKAVWEVPNGIIWVIFGFAVAAILVLEYRVNITGLMG